MPSTFKPFKAYEPGYLHIDLKYLPQMQDETARRYVFEDNRPGHALGVDSHQKP